VTHHDRPALPANQFGTPVDQPRGPVGVPAPSVTPHPFAAHAGGGETDVVAILALVFAVVLWPVAVVLGPIALRRTRRPGAGGRALAVAATWLAYVFFAIAMVGVVLAVAVPVFLSQRDKAVQADLRSDLRSAQLAMEGARVDLGSYPTALPQTSPLSSGTQTLAVLDAGPDHFCLYAVAGDTALYMDEAGTTSSYGCP